MYTFAVSRGSVTRVCVCEPRHVCTLATLLGCAMSLMSKMRMPRSRSLLTVSGTPCAPQSRRPLKSSPETKSRLRETDARIGAGRDGRHVVLRGCGAGGDDCADREQDRLRSH